MLALGTGISLLSAPVLAYGGSGGGGTGGGGTSGGGTGGGGGGGTASGVISFSNFGPSVPLSGGGWTAVGLQTSGFFNYDAEQFMPAVSGTVSGIRIPIHQYDTGGNGQFNFEIYTDNPGGPLPLGTLIGSFRGQSAQGISTAVSTIAVSNGPPLVAGQRYWAEVVPSSQSREAWATNPLGLTGLHFGIDANSWAASVQVQGAFEITVLP